MRVFAALPIPDAVATAVAASLPPVPDGMRAIPIRRWHLTLAFYGDLDESGVDCLQERLRRRLIPQDPVSLKMIGGGRFSSAAFLGVTCLDGSDEHRLREFAQICDRVGKACNAPGTQGAARFRPHVTVARTRRRGTIPREYVDQLSAVASPIWEARRVELISSVLGAAPQYELLRGFPVA